MKTKPESGKGNITLRQKSAFALQHLKAAAKFSRQCGKIQEQNIGNPLGAFYDDQMACVSAAVMLSVASLESNVNEYLSEPEKLFPDLNDQARSEVCELISPLSILDKYQKVLSIRGGNVYDKGSNPFQDADILVALRNELVHFHPEWHDEQERHRTLGGKLQYKFELSPFITEETGVLFPQRIISHGCTKWAVKSTLVFMENFSNRLEVGSRFREFGADLKG